MRQQDEKKNGSTTSCGTSCRDCVKLYDGRYCLHWRDVVPADVMEKGCDEIDQFPPF